MLERAGITCESARTSHARNRCAFGLIDYANYIGICDQFSIREIIEIFADVIATVVFMIPSGRARLF